MANYCENKCIYCGYNTENHIKGPKRDFKYRLEAPERACKAGIISLGVGALLGLHNFRSEAFYSALNAYYIQQNYPHVELCMSLPRIRPYAGSQIDIEDVNDKNIVQIMLAYKLFLSRAGINITTRERQEFRDNLLSLRVIKISAGVSTEVGGYTKGTKGEAQFDIADNHSIEEVKTMIRKKGFNPVFKDWQRGII